MDYYVDALLRSNPTANPNTTDLRATRPEIARILTSGLRGGDVPEPERTYMAQVVAARTGLNQAEAEHPVPCYSADAAATITSRRNCKGVSPTASARRPVAALLPSREVAPPESMSDGACFSNSPFLQRSPDLRNGQVVAGFDHTHP
jgi:hypothetical protein